MSENHTLLRSILLIGVLTTGGLTCTTPIQAFERGVILDEAQSQVLLMHPEGGVEAVDLLQGATRWRNLDASMPMALLDGQLMALGEPAKRGLLLYAVIDTDTGATLARQTTALPLPARALVDERLGETFQLRQDGEQIEWAYHGVLVTGARLATAHGPSLTAASLPQFSETSDVLLQGQLEFNPGTVRLSEAVGSKPTAKPVVVEIGLPAAGAPRRFRASQGEHVLVSVPLGEGRYRWQIEDANGRLLGSYSSKVSYLPFQVADNTLLFVKPLSMSNRAGQASVEMPAVQAIDLGNGQLRWSRELRDTRYRGPFPP